jgi:F-type H+-transporting ATPase subunit delta
METQAHPSLTAISYARAILELAEESNSAPAVGVELGELKKIVDGSAEFAQVLSDPAIGTAEREKLIRDVFGGRAAKLVLNFLLLLNEKGRLGLLGAISTAFDQLLDEKSGKAEVDVTVALALSEQQLADVTKKIGAALKREAVVRQHVDPSIIGGLIVQVQDQYIDGSVKAQLAAMRRQLLAGRPN